jgi:hypothetical protein
MGTNYYLLFDVCPHCGRPADKLHIGKSSAGWCFALHVEPSIPDHPKSLDDWQRLWEQPANRITDEYGKTWMPSDMLLKIRDRLPYSLGIQLNRSRIDGVHCIGHGDGTYDLITGEFS